MQSQACYPQTEFDIEILCMQCSEIIITIMIMLAYNVLGNARTEPQYILYKETVLQISAVKPLVIKLLHCKGFAKKLFIAATKVVDTFTMLLLFDTFKNKVSKLVYIIRSCLNVFKGHFICTQFYSKEFFSNCVTSFAA